MNERELKSLFCSSLRSNHVKNNTMIPTSEIRIVQEAHSRSFDLLIAAVTKEPNRYDYGLYDNILVRTQLLKHFARHEKCRIDCIRFYPVEVKSDDDVLDERLPKQIIDAILAFGLSILVLDKNHSKLARGLGKFLPTTVICYTGIDDQFEVVSRFDHLISSGVLNLKKTILAKALEENSTCSSGKAYNRLVELEHIFQKIIFNQIYFENLGMTKRELEFLQMITGIRPPPSQERKNLSKLIKETSNTKMTDYL
jgi:hypothetical protein